MKNKPSSWRMSWLKEWGYHFLLYIVKFYYICFPFILPVLLLVQRWLRHCRVHLAVNWTNYWNVQYAWIYSVSRALSAAFTHSVLSVWMDVDGFFVAILSVQYASVFQLYHLLEFVVCRLITALSRYVTSSVMCKAQMVLIKHKLTPLQTQIRPDPVTSVRHNSV